MQEIPNTAEYLLIDAKTRKVVLAPNSRDLAETNARKMFKEGGEILVCKITSRHQRDFDTR